MPKKYKMTGCAKFFIFLILAGPISYIAASYYNGSDPFENLRNIEIFNKKDTPDNDDTKTINAPVKNESTLKKELELKDEEINFMRKKIEKLEELVKTQKKEIDKLKSNSK